MVVYWHKRDYRFLDNAALNCGLELARANDCALVPIMGLENDMDNYEFDTFHVFALLNAMIPLYNNYVHHKINPFIFDDNIVSVLNRLNNKTKITHLISHQEHGTSYTYERDHKVSQYCKLNNIEWIQLQPSSIVRGLKSRDDRDKYWKAYVNSPYFPIPSFEGVKTIKVEDDYDQLVKLQSSFTDYSSLAQTSEKNGLKTLHDFINLRADKYKGSISSPNTAIEFGTRLSQYIAYGSLSIRYIIQSFWQGINLVKLSNDKKTMAGILSAMTRIHWREHFIQRLEDEHSMADVTMNVDYNNIEYANNPEHIKAFETGHTGEPMIDSVIRCLNKTGFINFRMRAMLVSYATFALDIDWRIIGRILAKKFLDYEPGIHWSQIQMQAGITGINSVRVYSPSKQLKDQDSQAIFVKKWIPELAEIEPKDILNYDKISLSDITNCNYPDPICDTNQCIRDNKAKVFEIKKLKTDSSKAVFVKHGSRMKKKTKAKKKIPKVKVVNKSASIELL